MARLLIIPAVLLVLFAGAALWSGVGHDSRADFTYINRGENKSLDPNGMSWLQDIRLAYGLWEGLYTLDPVHLQPIAGCAGAIDISDDKTVYTFHLRPEARWSNGDPLETKDFLFEWRRMLEQPGDYTYLFYYIKGAEAYEKEFAAGKPADFGSVGIKALDAKTLRVTLEHPVPFFPSLCAFPPFFPLNQRTMEKFADRDEKTGRTIYKQEFTRPPNLVTNGPYEMIEWSFKRRIRLRASEYYWDRAHVKSRIIDQIYSDDALPSFLMYDSGEVDWLAEVTGDLGAELQQAGRKDLRVFPGFGTYFLSVNCQPKFNDGRPNPLADVRVRWALAMAIDKKPIVQNVTRMGEPISTTYIPRGIFPGYPSPAGQPFDPEQARELLKQAGYPDGKNFPLLSLLVNSEGQHGQIAQVVQRQWLTNLHIDVTLESVEIKIFGERLHTKEYALARASWIGDYDDPSTFTDKYLSTSDNNDSGWINLEYDKLCAAAALEPDATKRLTLLAAAEKLICDEAPIIPLYNYVNVYMFRDKVHGIATDPRNMVMFKSIGVDR